MSMYVCFGLSMISINTLSVCTNLGGKTTSLECLCVSVYVCVGVCEREREREASLCVSMHKAKPAYQGVCVYCCDRV